MERNSILSADVLDILFDGRNKLYGAYDLRKNYHKRMAYALLGTIAIIALLFVANKLLASFKKTINAPVYVADYALTKLQEEIKNVPPPPPALKQATPQVAITQFTNPIISNNVREEEQPPEQAALETTKIGLINRDGEKEEGIVAPPIDAIGTGKNVTPKVVAAEEEKFTSVQLESEFPGGAGAWKKYLERNLDSEIPTLNGAPPGIYTVVLSFKVDKTGVISDIKVEANPGFGTQEEAVKVIQKGPVWKPANQNGKLVGSIKKQAITFVVSD